jgi:hypothetical protein
VSAFGLIGFFTVPPGREEFIPLIKGMVRVSPKPVHEIIVRAQRRKRVYRHPIREARTRSDFKRFTHAEREGDVRYMETKKKKRMKERRI